MTQLFFEIAQDEKTNAELIANLNHVLIRFGKKRELEENNLSDAVIADDFFELLRAAEQRNAYVVDLIVVRNQADGSKTNLGFALQPFTELGRALARADQDSFVFPPENPPGQNRREIIMREEKHDVEPRNEVEQKYTRDECVFGRHEIKHKQSDARRRLPKTEPVWPKQFVLQEKIFRATQRFQSQPEHEHSAVNAVTAPGQRAAFGIKRHHDPDADPENRGDNDDLAKQEDAVKSFRPLREHVYLTAMAMRVRDGRTPSTRAKIPGLHEISMSPASRFRGKSDSHTIVSRR